MKIDNTYFEQISLEEEMRKVSNYRFLKEHQENNLGDTKTGSYLTYNYINPITEALDTFLDDTLLAEKGRAGRRNSAARCLSQVPSEVSAYLTCRVLLGDLEVYPKHAQERPPTVTAVAMRLGGTIADEVRIRKFERENSAYLKKLKKDFDERELPRYKRLEYLQRVIKDSNEEWDIWSPTDKLHVGIKLLDIFIQTTGDMEIRQIKSKHGKHWIDSVVPSEGLENACKRLRESLEDITCVWYPMLHKPVPWSSETLNRGGYLSHNVTPYPLVKGSRRAYRRLITKLAQDGELETTLTAVNALQETPWRVNKRVLDAVSYVFSRGIECGKLPPADALEPPPTPPEILKLPKDHPEVRKHRQERAIIHEANRRIIGKRAIAIRTLHMAERFSRYERFYFPHDLDSRGRAYPKVYPLSPQGPDYVKGLLEFADGKSLGEDGLWWLGVHGANCYGEDKEPLEVRERWAKAHIREIQGVASDPHSNLWWTTADNPVQFLAFCLEYAEAVKDPSSFVSHLHVDLDATCSGLQHFSAMLRDEVGGFHVNMVPNPKRQDVYGAVAQQALLIFDQHWREGGDRSGMAKAWLDSGLMDRKTTKRSVMVKPYAGTIMSCKDYVIASVTEKLKDGHPLPWPEDDLFQFKLYGGEVVWEAIPKVVVAADAAMKWLSAVARAVGKSQPEERRIEWTTPVGLPVWQYKMDMKSRQVRTHLDGRIYKPRLISETNKLDSRKMASSVPPSFVHSLDAAHLQLTVEKAVAEDIHYFAMVHDSFGVHAADVPRFSKIIREAFVDMYQHDVLTEFYENVKPLINEELLSEIPPKPQMGKLDLNGVLESEFFFS